MSLVDSPAQGIAQVLSEACKTPLRTYSRRRGQSIKPLSSQKITDKRIFRRINSFHDAPDDLDATTLSKRASASPRPTESWMVLVQSGRRDSDSQYEGETTPQSPSLPTSKIQPSLDDETTIATSEKAKRVPIDDDKSSSDDFSDTEGDLTVLLDSAARYRHFNTPASARARVSKPVIRGRYLIFDKSPPMGYKVLKKPGVAVAQAPKKATSGVGDRFSSDEARPSGVAWSGKKRKRMGMLDSMDALELTTSTQKELEALRRIKPPKLRQPRKPDNTDDFNVLGAPKPSIPQEVLISGHPGESDTHSAPYIVPISHIFEDVDPGCDRKIVQAQAKPENRRSPSVHQSGSQDASENYSVAKGTQSGESISAFQDQGCPAGQDQDSVLPVVIPQSSWISESQDLNM